MTTHQAMTSLIVTLKQVRHVHITTTQWVHPFTQQPNSTIRCAIQSNFGPSLYFNTLHKKDYTAKSLHSHTTSTHLKFLFSCRPSSVFATPSSCHNTSAIIFLSTATLLQHLQSPQIKQIKTDPLETIAKCIIIISVIYRICTIFF